jgi:5-methylcytosine-specific restriction endonuclease McrA
MPRAQKQEVLQKLESKSSLECEKELLKLSSVPLQISKPQRERILDDVHTEVKLVLEARLMLKLKRIQALRSHANPSLDYAELLEFMADDILKRLDPLEKKAAAMKTGVVKEADARGPDSRGVAGLPGGVAQKSEDAAGESSEGSVEDSVRTRADLSGPGENRPGSDADVIAKANTNRSTGVSMIAGRTGRVPIPAAIRQSVWQRDGGRCGYVDPKTRRACGSTYFLELDHVVPVALGGLNVVENLRLRCRAHNQRAAIRIFGYPGPRALMSGKVELP